jgi:hypothetical protein
MPQLIENKQNHPVLIANFEPNEIARKSEEKTKIQTRKHCAGEVAQKVENRERELRLYRRGLFEGDLPSAVAAEAEAGAAVIVGESVAVEGASACPAVDDNGGVIAEHFDLELGPSAVVDFVGWREDDTQNGSAVEDLAVGRDVNVVGSHEAVHGGAVVFEPGGVPGFAELFDLLLHCRVVHDASFQNIRCSIYPVGDDVVAITGDRGSAGEFSREEDEAEGYARRRKRDLSHRLSPDMKSREGDSTVERRRRYTSKKAKEPPKWQPATAGRPVQKAKNKFNSDGLNFKEVSYITGKARRFRKAKRPALGGEAADPYAFGGGFAEVDAGGAAGDGDGHGLVIFALMDADVGAGAELEALHEFEELGIFFEDAQDFVGAGDFRVGQTHCAEFAAEFGHASEERNAVGAADVAAEAFQQQVGDFGRNAVLEAFGFFVGARPIDADHFGEKFFGEPVA